MFNKIYFLVLLFAGGTVFSQKQQGFTYKKIPVSNDTILFSSHSVVSEFISLKTSSQQVIAPNQYWIDPVKGQLLLKDTLVKNQDTLVLRYLDYPEFLTKTYTLIDQSKIVGQPVGLRQLRGETREEVVLEPFDGLSTSGSLSRGITIGNNQNAVVDSNLDLQLSGEISKGVILRASIQDDNIPIQDGGYSQKLNEFDQIFIELYGKKWKIRGGDVFLENKELTFLNFNKKVQGVATQIEWGKKGTSILKNAIGVVRGQYAKSTFKGQEGNQGPYKLKGTNGELYVLVVSGSERVFVNGIALKRGESEDYVVDYGAGEIRFNPTYPITSEMRITVEYQYADRNYNRFVTYNGMRHTRNNWYAGGYVYAESDIKNQPLQQSLSDEQKQILSQAGDDKQLMVTPSAVLDTYAADKVVYTKEVIEGKEVFVYAFDETQPVYQVRFSNVGVNNGDYEVVDPYALNKIYQYIAPINGVSQGTYAPFVAVVAPVNLQVYAVEAGYSGDKTVINTEWSISQKDENLFSGIDDQDNHGIAGKLSVKQQLFDKKWKGNTFGDYQVIDQNFESVERILGIEFNRDWNIVNTKGDQELTTTGIHIELPQKGSILYRYDNLNYSDSFNGNKHQVDSKVTIQNYDFRTNNSVMNSHTDTNSTEFVRSMTQLKVNKNTNWVGGTLRIEDNQQKELMTDWLVGSSQRFSEWGAFVGRGDSTKVYVQVGYLERKNDSIRTGALQRVNTSQSYYVRSQLLQNTKNNLGVFANYRKLKFVDATKVDQPSLNSRLSYNGNYGKGLLQTSLLYENTSGTIAQQDFSYVEVEPGQGVYTWIDYNANGIKELSEFEVAQFNDQATYVRLFLPNQIFVPTHQNKLSNSLVLNPSIWQNEKGRKRLISHFYNHASFQLEKKIRQGENGFVLNPFSSSGEVMGVTSSIRNSLFYNRGLQKHSLNYNIIQSQTQFLLATGKQHNKNYLQQLQYQHLIDKTWLLSFDVKRNRVISLSENFMNRNYELLAYTAAPKIGLQLSNNRTLNVFYVLSKKKNVIMGKEGMTQHQLGIEGSYQAQKGMNMRGQFSYYENEYIGNSNSAVAYQMLEGLLPGTNFTWQLMVRKSLTTYLDVNLNYQGRKGGDADAIHTGSMQLRAFF